MAKTKDDYAQLGRMHAHHEAKATPFLRESQSWQARVYWAAFDEETAKRAGTENKKPEWDVQVQGVTLEKTTNASELEADLAKKKFARSIAATESGRVRSDNIRISQMPANTAGWPRAAAEHALRLAMDHNKEVDPVRRNRLTRSLQRLQVRHAKIDL